MLGHSIRHLDQSGSANQPSAGSFSSAKSWKATWWPGGRSKGGTARCFGTPKTPEVCFLSPISSTYVKNEISLLKMKIGPIMWKWNLFLWRNVSSPQNIWEIYHVQFSITDQEVILTTSIWTRATPGMVKWCHRNYRYFSIILRVLVYHFQWILVTNLYKVSKWKAALVNNSTSRWMGWTSTSAVAVAAPSSSS